MFKHSTGAALLLLSTSAWSSVYLGIGVGPDTANFNQNTTTTHTIDLNVNDNTRHGGMGLFVSLFGGYAWMRNQFYIAGEGNVNASSVKSQFSNDEFVSKTFSSTKYRMRNNWGLSILPGYVLKPGTLFYGRIGYANGNFNSSTTDISLVSVNRHLDGFRVGLGMKQALTQQIAVRFDYSQIYYKNTSFTYVGAVTKQTNISPTTSQAEFALIYDFV